MKYDEKGLVPAIVQDGLTGEVRMLAWMSPEALAETRGTGLATFYSRSRQKLWVKGESSGNRLGVRRVFVDCDEDTLLVDADPQGPTCHTGQPSCFFRDCEGDTEESAAPLLVRLERTIEARVEAAANQSYTRSLLDSGAPRIADKIREEADELGRALTDETDSRVVSEAADVLFHLMVGLRGRKLAFRAVLAELERRMGQSGIDEKRARSSIGGQAP
jgi:phosphoribosyl-AMP cyclohydrolase / phosphoribosyl-ATP pyrophosphohydrolase